MINLVCRKEFLSLSLIVQGKMDFVFELTLVVINVQHKCKSVSRITQKHSVTKGKL